jgi:tetratricopeptide (TPR) repeat protein
MAASSSSADIEAFRLLRAGRFDDALPFAQRAVVDQRVCAPSHGLLATILLRLGRASDAAAVVARACELPSGIADAYDGLAYVSTALGQHEQANALYRRATELAPDTPRFWYNLACSDRSLGRLAEAEAAGDRSIASDPTQYPSYLLRSELRVQTPDFNHVEELRRRLAEAGNDYRATMFLGYALGKELDDLQRFDEAFRWFSTAAQARRSRLQYDVSTDEDKLRRIAEVYAGGGATADGAKAPATARSDSAAGFDTVARSHAARAIDSSQYLFIVGLPRSGTTLTERILTGLANVRSNGETENFSRSLLAATAAGPADIFARAAEAPAQDVAANYARAANVSESTDAIIEKLPMNYLYLGAIARALPDAKILTIRRSPLDSCFAMYRTLFRDAYPFSYDLTELARYYAAYERLMNHWRAVLGSRLHEILYEELVKDPHRVGAAAAAHCGLSWSDTAVDIQRNAAVSLTASAAQIRRPIYGTSSGRWRHYRAQLAPLIQALRSHGVELPEDV